MALVVGMAVAALLAATVGAISTASPGGATASPTSAPSAAGSRATVTAPGPLEASPLDSSPTPDIIPQPNSGSRPQRPGERGGTQQTAVFFAICGAIVLLGFLAVLDGRRKKRRAAARATSTLSPSRPGPGASPSGPEPASASSDTARGVR